MEHADQESARNDQYEGVPIRLVKKIPLCGYGEANVDRQALQEEVRALD